MRYYNRLPRSKGELIIGGSNGDDKKEEEEKKDINVIDPEPIEDDEKKKPTLNEKERKEILKEISKCMETLKPPKSKKKDFKKPRNVNPNVKVGGAIKEL